MRDLWYIINRIPAHLLYSKNLTSYISLCYKIALVSIFHSEHPVSSSLFQKKGISIQDLLPYITRLSHKLLPLGVALGIANHANGILAGNETTQDKCIMILTKWLEVTAHPTWKDFCENLRQPGLEMVSLANEIEEKHCPHTSSEFPL